MPNLHGIEAIKYQFIWNSDDKKCYIVNIAE